jgi:predicted dehydrogenase
MDGVRAVGITSRTISKVEKLAETYAIEQVYENIDSLIKKCTLDALMILVSANQIYDVAVNLIPAGIPLFLEKPLGLLPEQTKTLTGLANKHGTKNMVGFNRRYYSIFHKGLEIINQNGGLLGLAVEGHERFWKIAERDIPDEIRQNWIYCNSTHTIDLLRLFGGEVEQINALKNSVKEKTGDQFVASMEFESGALGSYTSHWFSPGGWSVTLYGEGVTVKFKPLEKGIWIDTDFQQHDIMPDEVDIKYKQGFYKQMEAFVNMVRTGMLETPAMDLAEALKTMELAKEFAHA